MHGEAHCLIGFQGASGAMDNASDYGSEDSRFDSWLARKCFSLPDFELIVQFWLCSTKALQCVIVVSIGYTNTLLTRKPAQSFSDSCESQQTFKST